MDLTVYTDGSYSSSVPDRVTGGMVILQDGKLLCAQRYISKRQSRISANNIGGELLAATGGLVVAGTLIKANAKNEDDIKGTITLYHDYKGISEFIDGHPRWTPKKVSSKMYVASVNEFRKMYPNINVKFVKVKAHSGDKWNDVVDAIANGIDPLDCTGKMLPDYVQEREDFEEGIE